MERQLIMTGIGGQGVQLAAAVVARAALLEGRDVQVFGSYGGMMRGGATESTVVVADGPVESPPTVASTWSAVLMHHEHAATGTGPARTRTVCCSSTPAWSTGPRWPGDARWSRSRPTTSPSPSGAPWPPRWSWSGPTPRPPDWSGWHPWRPRSRASLPSYRTQHATLNDEALRAGFGSVTLSVPAWPQPAVTPMSSPPVVSRGTLVIDVEACKGCDLCIDAARPACW